MPKKDTKTEKDSSRKLYHPPLKTREDSEGFYNLASIDNGLSEIVLGARELNWSSANVSSNAYLSTSSKVAAANLVTDGIISILCLTHSIKRAYLNYIHIRDAKDYILKKEIDELSFTEIQKTKTYYGLSSTEDAIKKLIWNNMVGGITQNTLAPGIAGTALFVGISISLSLLFPPIAPLMFIFGLVSLGVGLTSTIGATLTNRFFMKQKLKTLLDGDKDVDHKLKSKSKAIENLQEEKSFAKFRKHKSIASKMADRLLDLLVATKALSVLNYISLVMKNITGTAQHIVMIVLSLSVAIKKHYSRKEKFHRFSLLLAEKFIPKINIKKYLFFGKSPFEKFIADNVKLEKNQSLSSYINYLKYQKPKLYQEAQEFCLAQEIATNYKKFCADKSLDERQDTNYKKFMTENISSRVKRDVRISGYGTTASVTIGLFSLSLMFPPLFIAGAIFAASTAIIGVIATETITKNENKYFSKKLNRLIDESSQDQVKEPKTHTEKFDYHAIQLLKTLKKTVSSEITLVSAPKDSPPTPGTSSFSRHRSKRIGRNARKLRRSAGLEKSRTQ